MSSVDEIRKEIEQNKKFARMTQNESSKLEYRKKIENLTMQLREAERKGGKPQQPQQPPKREEPKKEEPKKEEFNDINRGKVAEPGSSIPENKPEDKQLEDNKNQNNNNHNNKKN